MRFVVEVPRGGRVKWGSDGRVDYVSPWASPLTYGSAPDVLASDGDPLDVVVLGPPLPRGHAGDLPVWGVVRFVDDGVVDDKWVLGPAPPTPAEVAELERFFRTYARLKRWLGRLRWARGDTRSGGWEPSS